MSPQAMIYLSITIGLFVIFAALVRQTYRKGSRDRIEAPKYRMLDDE